MDPRDAQFWARQMHEHCTLIAAALDPGSPFKKIAAGLAVSWQNPSGVKLLDQTIEFKTEVLRTAQTSWIGWLAPDFYHHVLEEAVYFRRLIADDVTSSEELAIWREILSEHAISIGAMVDPSRRSLILRGFQVGDMAKRSRNVSLASRDVERFLQSTARVPSTIPKILRDHAIAEGVHFREVVMTRAMGR